MATKAKAEQSVKGRLRGTTIYEIGKSIYKTDKPYKKGNTPTIVDKLTPKKIGGLSEGYHVLKPANLASLLVPRLEVTGNQIHGFQRPKIIRSHISKLAKAMEQGKVMPAAELADYKNSLWVVDGQHRVISAILADSALPVLVRKMTAEEMKDLFADQSKGVRVNPSTIVLSASDPFAEYVQDAVTSNDHPWSQLVTHTASSSTKMTPKQMYDAVGRYVSNTIGSQWSRNVEAIKFDSSLADELAELFLAFGTKKSNSAAYRPVAINAITYAAVIVIRRNGSRKSDIERWKSWMASFNFAEYIGINRARELGFFLVRHWNKRLSTKNKLPIPDELT